MDKEIVVLLIGMLIIGLAGGFILNFIVYQPQIQSLRNDLAALEDEIASQFAENEETLSDLNEAIGNLSSTIDNLNRTSETGTENETTIYDYLAVQAQAAATDTHFVIDFVIANYGTVATAVDLIYLNQIPIQNVSDVESLTINGAPVSLSGFTVPLFVGQVAQGTILLVKGLGTGLNLQSGTALELKFRSTLGYNYSTIVNLP